ncbi:MAG TPA: peptidyl-prolyl cis-trans isomerase [Gaiellales bacterium]|nr:peptidyl-prolyl cis-trans isomerase [Gaiellales bacterium]
MGRALRILLLAALTAAFSAACGGGSDASSSAASLESGDVAVVGATHITKTQLDHWITLRVKGLEAQNQTAPKPGTTDYTTNIVQPTLQHLVQEAQVRNIADTLNLSVSDSEYDKALKDAVQQNYGGDESKLQADLKKFGLSNDDLRYEFETTLLENKITDKLTNQVKVTDQDVKDYYDKNTAAYKTTSDTRVVDYALFPDKASAQAALQKLADGATFKDVSAGTIDTSANHEPFTAQKGQVDKAFEQSAFTLPTDQLSPLVKVDKAYATSSLPGKCQPDCYFLIRPTADVVKSGTQQSFDQVKSQIRTQLLSTRKQSHVTSILRKLEAAQKKLTKYATGYAPPPASTAAPATT